MDRKTVILLIFVIIFIILLALYSRILYLGEKFVSPVFDADKNLISDRGEYEGRAGFFSYFPFLSQYNSYLNDTMSQRPCTTDFQCKSGNCSGYGYCAEQYKRLIPSAFGNDD
jgi:hypothetical protein